MMIIVLLTGLLAGVVVNVLADVLPKTTDDRRSAVGGRWSVVVVVTALLFVVLYLRFGWSLHLAVVDLYAAILVLISVIDLEHRRVLNAIVLPSAVAALAISLVSATPSLPSALVGGAVGFAMFAVIAIVQPNGMGMGDVKLAGLIGLMLGFPLVVTALLIGMIAGGIIGVLVLLLRAADRKSTMPYAPALVLGSFAALLYGPRFI